MKSHAISAEPPLKAATPKDIVDALKAVAGNPPKVRASFAKGICVRGRYEPSPDAGSVTRSKSFTRPSDVVGRFSVGGGSPAVADTNRMVLRGLSVRLGAPDARTDLIVETAPVHFARTLDQMLAFLRARVPGQDGKPDPNAVKAFSDANPETLNQARFVASRLLPGSFAGAAFWGVHAFPATNEGNETRFIKFKVVPADGEVWVADSAIDQWAPDFLRADLAERFALGGARCNVLAILDRPGDPVMDVTQRWPDEDERDTVLLGSIVLDGFEPEGSCDATISTRARSRTELDSRRTRCSPPVSRPIRFRWRNACDRRAG